MERKIINNKQIFNISRPFATSRELTRISMEFLKLLVDMELNTVEIDMVINAMQFSHRATTTTMFGDYCDEKM